MQNKRCRSAFDFVSVCGGMSPIKNKWACRIKIYNDVFVDAVNITACIWNSSCCGVYLKNCIENKYLNVINRSCLVIAIMSQRVHYEDKVI